MSKIGIQSQNGTIPEFDRVVSRRPIAWMLLGNAIGLKLARDIRARSPDTLILLRTGPDWDYKSWDFIRRYLEQALFIADPFQREGLCDFLCPPNEPVVRNHIEAQQLNDQQVWYADQVRSRGYRTAAYNFSVGNPDYPLWQWLQPGIRACDYWLFVHQYDVGAAHPFLFPDTSLRHEKFIPLLDADVQINLKIGITECLDDLNTKGEIYGHGGGYNALPQNGHLMQDYIDHLSWWESEIAKEPRIKFATVFGYAMLDPWVGLGFDVAQIDTDRDLFLKWLQPGKVDLSPTPPPVDPPPIDPPPVDPPIDPPPVEPPVDPLPDPRPEGATVMMPFKVPEVLLSVGLKAAPATPVVDLPFYRLFWRKQPDGKIGGAGLRHGVSAFAQVGVYDRFGLPAVGVKVVSLFPDGNGEVGIVTAAGDLKFNFGPSAAFTPPADPPFRMFVASDDANKPEDQTPKRVRYTHQLSDMVWVGDPLGPHLEIQFMFVEQVLAGIPTTLIEAIRYAAYPAKRTTIAQYNPDAALQNVARKRGLESVETDEVYIQWAGTEYVFQGFSGGIVYTEVGHFADADIKTAAW